MSNLHVVKDGPSNIGDDPTAGRFSYVRGRIHDHAFSAYRQTLSNKKKKKKIDPKHILRPAAQT